MSETRQTHYNDQGRSVIRDYSNLVDIHVQRGNTIIFWFAGLIRLYGIYMLSQARTQYQCLRLGKHTTTTRGVA